MKIQEIKDRILISDFLSKLGHNPIKTGGKELMYHSPYRTDRTPSFSVNDKDGLWYDHGDAMGGNIIDLGILVFETPFVKDVVRRINEMYDGHDLSYLVNRREKLKEEETSKRHEIVRVKPLGGNNSIMTYLNNRRVLDIAMRVGFIKEVYYDYINDSGDRKRYFGAGWQNDRDGWDIRSKYGKVNIEAKGINVIAGNSGKTNVFEGMINYLSALEDKAVSLKDTTVVLNGLGQYERGLHFLKGRLGDEINIFFDHGVGGDKYTPIYQSHFPSARDRRDLYNGFSDYNEKFCFDIEHRNSSKLHR